jgi:WhiB family redox-sensing transcriptional regulator
MSVRERRTVSSVIDESHWTAHAVCARKAPDALFVEGAAQREARCVCRGCPVQMECLADALDNRMDFGVWGGMTERERRALLRRSPEIRSWREVLLGDGEQAVPPEFARAWI